MPLPILTSTLQVVQGATLTRVLQGYNEDGSIPSQFLGTDTLSCTVWQAQGEPSIITPAVSWFNAAQAQVTVTIAAGSGANASGNLSVDTTYNLQVFATRSGAVYPVAWCYLLCLPAAGSQAAALPPDLVAASFAIPLLQALALEAAQLEQIPTAITCASAAARSWCNDRDFTQQSYTKEFEVGLNGYVRLDQIPVNQVLRVQSQPQTALSVANTATSSVQDAWIVPSYTGTAGAWGGQTLTGLVLYWISSGVQSSNAITFAANETFTSLASTINAVGSGWTAVADPIVGAFPVTELVGPFVAQGAMTTDGVQMMVYSQTLSSCRFHPDDGQNTGMLFVGRQYSGESPRWGPGWEEFGSVEPITSKVKVTYNAGFAVIPYEVQLAVVETVKAYLERLRTDLVLKSETAGKYQYEVASELLAALPRYVLMELSRYRIHNA